MTRLIFQILLRTAGVCGLLLGLVLAAIGHTPPVLERIPAFAVCKLPCWAGVTPLETSFDEVAELVMTNLPFHVWEIRTTNDQVRFNTTQGSPQIAGVAYADRGGVSGLRLDVALPVWMLLDLLGEPTCARTIHLLNSTKDSLSVYWEGATHSIVSVLLIDESEHWSPGAPTRYLFITAFNNECALLNAPTWQGFTPLWRYRVDLKP